MPYKRSSIISVGTAVPETVVTNAELEKTLDTSDEWITKRTGIRERRISPRDGDVWASHLGGAAAQKALEKAGLSAADIDGIICATFTPDSFFPSTACRIGSVLGQDDIFAFDISAACSGFLYGLTTAHSLIVSGQCETVLLVGSEIISKTLDWTDRTTAILFGDAAGAAVIRGTNGDAGVQGTHLTSFGSLGSILELPAFGDRRYMTMNGSEVFKHAVRMMRDASQKCLKQCGLTTTDIDLVIPHQANVRIINALTDALEVEPGKVVVNVQRFGNTSSASIPLALEEAWEAGRIRRGTRVLFTALGGGVTVASAVVTF